MDDSTLKEENEPTENENGPSYHAEISRKSILFEGDDNAWTNILELMYSTGGTAALYLRNAEDEEGLAKRPLFRRLDEIPDRDIVSAINLLERSELVEKKSDTIMDIEYEYLQMTKRGFEVAHERELATKQQETNDNLAFFTLILGFAAILQTVAAAVQLDPVNARIGLLLLTILLTLSLAFYQSKPLSWGHNLISSTRK